jgi:hypothetical protein
MMKNSSYITLTTVLNVLKPFSIISSCLKVIKPFYLVSEERAKKLEFFQLVQFVQGGANSSGAPYSSPIYGAP